MFCGACWPVCSAADQSERAEKEGWRRGGGEQPSHLWGVWTQRSQAPAAGVHPVWFRVWHFRTIALVYSVVCWLIFNFLFIPNREHTVLVVLLKIKVKGTLGSCDCGFHSRYHMDCLRPPLNTSPEDDWVCPECAVIPQHTGRWLDRSYIHTFSQSFM